MSGYLTEDEQREKDREQKRRTARQQIIEHARKPLLFTAFDVKWVPISATIAAAGHHPNMTGALNLYQLQEGELVPVVEARTPNAIRCITFGHNRRSGVEDLNAASTGVAGATRRLVAAGDFTGALSVYDIESMTAAGAEQQEKAAGAPGAAASRLSSINGASALQIKPVISYGQAHASMINCIDGALFSGPPEIATGGRDGAVRVWDLRQAAKPVVALVPKVQGNTAPGGLPGASRDCWSVKLGGSFAPDERVVAAGYDNGDVKIYDMRAGKMRHEFTVSNGVCDLEFDRPDIDCNKLLVSTLEGRVRVYDVRTLHPELGYAYVEERVSTGTIWATRALPQNRDVFISGGAGELTLCKYNYPPERALKDPATGQSKGVAGTVEELNKVKLGDQPVNSIDWHPGREGLLAASAFDQTLRVMLVTKLGLIS